MQPISFFENVPQFSKYQVDLLGCPSVYGYEFFEVIETDDSITYATDFTLEHSYHLVKRVVHVYCRMERFSIILAQLMCMSINVSNKVLMSNAWLDMIDEVAEIEENHWMTTRKILKKYNFNTYYNRIPGILALAKNSSNNNYTSKAYSNIIKDFKKMHVNFEEFKGIKYSYFPNLRFVALKLMQYHQVYPDYDIPLAITKSKIVSLEKTFDDLWFYINTKL